MSVARISVEHSCGNVKNTWGDLAYVGHQMASRTAPGKQYAVATLLTNANACLYRNETTIKYGMDPPTLEEYFAH